MKVFGDGFGESGPIRVVVKLVDDHFLSMSEGPRTVMPRVVFARGPEHQSQEFGLASYHVIFIDNFAAHEELHKGQEPRLVLEISTLHK